MEESYSRLSEWELMKYILCNPVTSDGKGDILSLVKDFEVDFVKL